MSSGLRSVWHSKQASEPPGASAASPLHLLEASQQAGGVVGGHFSRDARWSSRQGRCRDFSTLRQTCPAPWEWPVAVAYPVPEGETWPVGLVGSRRRGCPSPGDTRAETRPPSLSCPRMKAACAARSRPVSGEPWCSRGLLSTHSAVCSELAPPPGPVTSPPALRCSSVK